ncbi:MAG: hypothetical protein R3Y05_01395 [bacterium]
MRFEDLKPGSKVAGGGTTGLGIIGTALGGIALANQSNGGCGNNGGILGGIFGGHNDCHLETKEASHLREQVAILASERYADHIGLSVYNEVVKNDKEVINYINHKFEVLTDRVASNDKLAFIELARLDKETALNKQANEFTFALTNKEIQSVAKDSQYQDVILNNKIDCNAERIRCYVDGTFVPGNLVMPLSSICPQAMPLYSDTETK